MTGQAEEDKGRRKWRKNCQCCRFMQSLIVNYGQNSTMHGLSHLFSAESKRKQAFWFVLVTLGFIMIVIHLHMHIRNVLKSPVSTIIEHEGENFIFPDVTFCSLNPINSRMYLRVAGKNRFGHTKEDYIVLGTLYSLAKLRSLSRVYSIDTKIHRRVIERQRSTYSSLKRSFFPSKELIFSCTYRGKNCMNHFVLLNDPHYWNCYTFRPRVRTVTTTNPEEGLVVIAYTATEDIEEFTEKLHSLSSVRNTFFNNSTIVDFLTAHSTGKNFYARILQNNYEPGGLKIAIHDPYTHVQPRDTGFIVANGQYAKVGLDMYYEDRLNRKGMECENSRVVQFVRAALNSANEEIFQPYVLQQSNCQVRIKQNDMEERCGCMSNQYPVLQDHRTQMCYNYTAFLSAILATANMTRANIPDYNVDKFINYINLGQRLAENSPEAVQLIKAFRARMDCHDREHTSLEHETTDEHSCIFRCRSAVYKYYLSAAPWPRDYDLFRMLQDVVLPAVTNRRSGRFRDIARDIFQINPTNESDWNSSTALIHRNFARIVVHPTKLKSNVHKEQNTYSLLEVLSEVGGILGLWLGMSILTVFEIVEMAIEIVTNLATTCAKKTTSWRSNGGEVVETTKPVQMLPHYPAPHCHAHNHHLRLAHPSQGCINPHESDETDQSDYLTSI